MDFSLPSGVSLSPDLESDPWESLGDVSWSLWPSSRAHAVAERAAINRRRPLPITTMTTR